jgi:DNA-binding SARP family transcriptional activator
MQEPATTRCCYANGPLEVAPVTVTLLGPFTIRVGGSLAGPWPRPSAKRLCELVMVRPHHRLVKEVVCETLFANLAPQASANALSKAVSMARHAVSPLGTVGSRLLRADRHHICVPAEIPLEIDLVAHEAALRSALAMEPGDVRDASLSAALLEEGVLLDDEPYSDWAVELRTDLERLRQSARTELARDRTRGWGRSQPESVIDAWEICLAHDPASEEAVLALMTAYASVGQRHLVVRTYRRYRQSLEDLGLKPSLAIESAYWSATDEAAQLITR